MSKNTLSNGFSLVEIIVVIAVVGVVGIIITDIFLSSLRGSNKAAIIDNIKRNGQGALETMDKNIRNSRGILCPVLPSALTSTKIDKDEIVIQTQDNKYIRYKYIDPTTTTNGRIQVDYPQPTQADLDPVNLSSYCLSIPIATELSNLTDANPKTGISVLRAISSSNPSGSLISINTKEGYSNIVTINFMVKPGVQSPAAYSGQIDSENFQTTIQLR